jgi:hypothetical protein
MSGHPPICGGQTIRQQNMPDEQVRSFADKTVNK